MTYWTVHYIYQNKVEKVIMFTIHLWIFFSLDDVDNAFSAKIIRESLFPSLTSRFSVSFIDFENLCFLFWLRESLFPLLTARILLFFTDFEHLCFLHWSLASVSLPDFVNLFFFTDVENQFPYLTLGTSVSLTDFMYAGLFVCPLC